MDQLVQCPVCTLYLHNGMSLESHLDTHPKDQVIKALCSLSSSRSSYGSRASTPMHSERSYRSRSRTPATEENGSRWNTPHLGSDHERFWRRTPSRTPKTSTVTRSDTPDTRLIESNFENGTINNLSSGYTHSPYPSRIEKSSQLFGTAAPVPDYDQQYPYFSDQKEEKELKYSRSAEYSSLTNTPSNIYTYNMPSSSSCMKFQNALMPTPHKRNTDVVNLVPPSKKQDFIKILPKTNNIALVKANMGSVQYITPGVMVTAGPLVQKNPQNSLLVAANLQNTAPIVQSKTISTPISSNQFSQMTSSSFAPNTTVVTQNSQIIYSEMVHNLDGKRFVPGVSNMISGQENVTNVTQTNSVYHQNVMVMDQFGNTSCMYTAPQQLLPKPSTSVYNQNVHSSVLDKNLAESNKTLIIEVSPIAPQPPMDLCDASTGTSTPGHADPEPYKPEKSETQIETSSSNKGLKILSNIKVEVPVQHHKNLLNTVVDLTGHNETEYPDRTKTPERILPDLEVTVTKNNNLSDSIQASTPNSDVNIVSHTFSVIKNVGNPPSYKDSKIDSKIHETESSDSCPVPDLTCNEKPSISPCSELSDNGDNATAHASISPQPDTSQGTPDIKQEAVPGRPYRSNPLRLNNIYVKKNKKILQIKNAKSFPIASTSSQQPVPAAPPSAPRLPENFTVTKIHVDKTMVTVTRIDPEKIAIEDSRAGRLETVSIDKIHRDRNDFDADTEEQSMDMELEPVAPSSYESATRTLSTIDLTQVKDEVNSSNELSNQTDREFTELESMRPPHLTAAVQYADMAAGFDDDSNHRELLELEAASKSKQFVTMMSDNYFGDNIYADYFTAERAESLDSGEPPSLGGDAPREGVYGVWGESSQRDSEFVLPNFIHESYKIAESNGSYGLNGGMMGVAGRVAVEAEGCGDSKADVLSESRSDSEVQLNICADERMPPRGELSGQESNGDMDAPWTGMYPEVAPPEPYDLMARESWISDGSDLDSNEKRDTLEDEEDDEVEVPKPRLATCLACGAQFPGGGRELRAHRAAVHAPPPAARLAAAAAAAAATAADDKPFTHIKKEEKSDEQLLTGALQDSKANITASVLAGFDAIEESKVKLSIVKQEPRRRRRDFVCPTCKVDFMTDVAFHLHLRTHPLECLTCGKCFFRRANLALHIKTHLGIKNYKCEICEKRFLTRQKLMDHHNIHTGRAPVKCTLCDHTFRRYSNMVQHRDRHHLNKKPKVRDYVCHCGEIYHSRAKLRWHKETHDGKPKACQYCSDKFVHMSSLTRHVRRSHNSYYTRDDLLKKNENIPCPICKQVYLRSNLKTHMRTHSGKRPYTCVICNKSFTTQWNLKLHRWTHLSRSAKPFKCTLCKGAFIRHSEYVSHMNAHKSVRPYTCNYCGCQFIRKYNCQRHVREHEMAKKYVCKVPDCGKSFHRSYYLSEHMKVHSGARPFSCNICGKTSSNKSNHNKHVKIHHAREPVATEA